MSREPKIVYAHEHTQRAGLQTYVTGFILSIGLTLLAYVAAGNRQFSSGLLVVGLLGLAIIQFFVQIYFFLHLGRETRPRWRLLLLGLMILVVLIVVIGSIWIMYSLNYNMTQKQIQQYLTNQDGGI
jgi:cytochrome o ubiquinol oxidase operon protein cyoD